jgi:Asp-tRNA(Asn)/Glu-tRNA(Gln) amidotransferase A subunit family amidase
MSNHPLNELTAHEAIAEMAAGNITSEALTKACLDRIEEREETVQAWAYLDPEHALAQARECDRQRAAGVEVGSLHGVPVALKDIFDTCDMPTENGSRLFKGRRPVVDSFVAQLLRQAGAVIIGKSVSTEIAMITPSKTRNPHDPERTPGGSSSGSCASVGDRMVPMALGSQTSGSTLRPASFCGIYGYKPTFGSISCVGVSAISRKLDHVGPLARSLEDLALLSDALMVYDPRDEEMRGNPNFNLGNAVARPLDGAPRIGFARTPAWHEGDPETFKTFEAFVQKLGGSVNEVQLPDSFGHLLSHHDKIMGAGVAYYFGDEVDRQPPRMEQMTLDRIALGKEVTAYEYMRALDAVGEIRKDVYEAMRGYDALIVPPATGEAPIGFKTTGSPVFQAPWSLLGMPGLCLPMLKGPAGMPFGIQLMARKGDDAHLFRVAKWVETKAEAIA